MAPHLLRGCAPQAALCARPSVASNAAGARRPRAACAAGASSRRAARGVTCAATGETRAREAAPSAALPAAAPTRRDVLAAGAAALLALAPPRARADEEAAEAPVRVRHLVHAAARTPLHRCAARSAPPPAVVCRSG
jgi:hypothetical protein